MREPEVLVVDHSTDKIKEWRYAYDEEGALTDQSRESPLPEELMAKLEKHLGDAGAQVTVSADLATSVDYGNKAGAFVSIKITCNNSENDILAVHDIARDWVETLVSDNQSRMQGLLDNARSGGVKTVEAPPQDPVPTKARAGKRTIKINTSKVPDYRRQ